MTFDLEWVETPDKDLQRLKHLQRISAMHRDSGRSGQFRTWSAINLPVNMWPFPIPPLLQPWDGKEIKIDSMTFSFFLVVAKSKVFVWPNLSKQSFKFLHQSLELFFHENSSKCLGPVFSLATSSLFGVTWIGLSIAWASRPGGLMSQPEQLNTWTILTSQATSVQSSTRAAQHAFFAPVPSYATFEETGSNFKVSELLLL